MRILNCICVCLFLGISFLLVGCDEDEIVEIRVHEEPSLNVVQTVDWYETHPVEMKEVLALCNDNPGQLKDDANCKNASIAKLNLSAGKPKSVSNWKMPEKKG